MVPQDSGPEPGRVVVCPIDDFEWPWYWHAYVGDERINGGVCKAQWLGTVRGRDAIAVWRRRQFIERHYWDVETQEYYMKGTLPPVS